MPRGPRKRSASGIYHVMLRGINKQRIFHDGQDHQTFLEGMQKYKNLSHFELFAWCLMPNHLHLLLRESAEGEPIDKIMRRLGTWYVYRYNRRYERSGPLFEGRYKSEAVEDDNYFLTVLRYIHRNPINAGIVASPALYPYSSYSAYLADGTGGLADTQTLLALISRDEFAAWHEQEDKVACLDLDAHPRQKSIPDEKALEVMRKASNASSLETFRDLPDMLRERTLQRMRKAGASLNQIVRLTGTSMAAVRKAVGP